MDSVYRFQMHRQVCPRVAMLAEAARLLISNLGVERESRFGKEQVLKTCFSLIKLSVAWDLEIKLFFDAGVTHIAPVHLFKILKICY